MQFKMVALRPRREGTSQLLILSGSTCSSLLGSPSVCTWDSQGVLYDLLMKKRKIELGAIILFCCYKQE